MHFLQLVDNSIVTSGRPSESSVVMLSSRKTASPSAMTRSSVALLNEERCAKGPYIGIRDDVIIHILAHKQTALRIVNLSLNERGQTLRKATC